MTLHAQKILYWEKKYQRTFVLYAHEYQMVSPTCTKACYEALHLFCLRGLCPADYTLLMGRAIYQQGYVQLQVTENTSSSDYLAIGTQLSYIKRDVKLGKVRIKTLVQNCQKKIYIKNVCTLIINPS